MAGINVPANAQPQDLGNPIPGGTMGQTLQDVLGKFHPLANTQLARGQPLAQGSNGGPTFGQTVQSMSPAQSSSAMPSPQQSQSSPDDSQDDSAGTPSALPTPQQAADADDADNYEKQAADMAASLLDKTPEDQIKAAQDQHHDANAAALADQHLGQVADTDGAPAWVRFVGAMPKTPQGRLQVFQGIYGKDNAKFDGGEFLYRKDANAPWQSVSPQGLDWADVNIGNLSTLGQWWKGVDVAGKLPDIAEGAAGVGIAGAADLLSGGGAAPANAALMALGQGTAAMVRDAMNYSAGVEEAKDFSQAKDFLWSAGMGAAFHGVGVVTDGAVQTLTDAVRSTVSNRMAQMAVVRGAVDDIFQSLRLPSKTAALQEGPMPELTESSVGNLTKSAIDHWNEYLGTRVGIVKGTAINGAEQQGLSQFSVDTGLAKLREVIGDKVIQDSTTGELKLAANIDGLMGEQVGAQLEASQTSAWGDPAGKRVLNELVDKYNVYNAANKVNGGLPLQDLYDAVTLFGKRAAYDQDSPLNETIRNNFAFIGNAFATDRDSAITTSLAGTDLENNWKQDFEKYTEKINLIGQFGAKFQNVNSAEKISQAILQPKNADTLTKLTQILGSNSPQMDAIRDLWLSQRVSGAISADTAIFDPGAFIKDIDPKKWGPEMMDILQPDPGKLNQLKWAAQQASKISTTDFSGLNKDKSIQAVGLLSGGWKYANIAARNMFGLTKNNVQFADAMAKDGVNVLIKSAKNDDAVKNLLSGMGIYESMVDNSTIVQMGKNKILVPYAKPAAITAGKTMAVAGKDSMLTNQTDPNDDQQDPNQPVQGDSN